MSCESSGGTIIIELWLALYLTRLFSSLFTPSPSALSIVLKLWQRETLDYIYCVCKYIYTYIHIYTRREEGATQHSDSHTHSLTPSHPPTHTLLAFSPRASHLRVSFT